MNRLQRGSAVLALAARQHCSASAPSVCKLTGREIAPKAVQRLHVASM